MSRIESNRTRADRVETKSTRLEPKDNDVQYLNDTQTTCKPLGSSPFVPNQNMCLIFYCCRERGNDAGARRGWKIYARQRPRIDQPKEKCSCCIFLMTTPQPQIVDVLLESFCCICHLFYCIFSLARSFCIGFHCILCVPSLPRIERYCTWSK